MLRLERRPRRRAQQTRVNVRYPGEEGGNVRGRRPGRGTRLFGTISTTADTENRQARNLSGSQPPVAVPVVVPAPCAGHLHATAVYSQ